MYQIKILALLFVFSLTQLSFASSTGEEKKSSKKKQTKAFTYAVGKVMKSFFTIRKRDPHFPNVHTQWNHMMYTAVSTLKGMANKYALDLEVLKGLAGMSCPRGIAHLSSGASCHKVKIIKTVLPINEGIAAEWYVPASSQEQKLSKINLDELFSQDQRVILYLHGGAMCLCSHKTHREMILRLAKATGRIVLAIDYRKPPEHPYPLPLDDSFAVYKDLVAKGLEVTIAGDSAGGTLALAVTDRAKQSGCAMPNSLVLISPWVDLSEHEENSNAGGSLEKHSMVDFLPLASVKLFAESCIDQDHLAAGETLQSSLKKISPINFDTKKYPPVICLTGEYEMLYDQQCKFVRKLKEQGESCKHIIAPGMIHVYPFFAALGVRQAKNSFEEIAVFLGE